MSSGALIKFCHRYPDGYVFLCHILPYFSGADDGFYKEPSAALLDSGFYGVSLQQTGSQQVERASVGT